GPAAGVPDQQCMGGAPHIHCWDGTTPAQRAQNAGFSCPQQVAENEAGSWRQPTLLPDEAVENAIVGWTTEVPPNDGHLRNILSDATLTGVGAAIVTMGGRQFILIVQDFRRPCPGETGTTTPPPTPPTTPPPTPPTTPPPAEQPNLVIDKQAGPCALGPGDTVQCPFTITVTNIGQGDFNGPLDISEDVGFDRANLDFSPPFVCTPTGGGTGAADCRLDNASIPAGGSTTLTLTTNIAHGDVASAPCQLVNRATLNLGGAGPNPEAATQADISGVAPTCDGGAGQAPGPGGGAQPNLIISKQAAACTLGPGDTVQCPFTITVRNVGQGDFNGPLDITEDAGFDRANLSFAPPFVGTPTGGGTGAFDGQWDNAPIPAGGSTILTAPTNIAHGDVASAPCHLINRATLNLGGPAPSPEAATSADLSAVAPTCAGGGAQPALCPPGTTGTPGNCAPRCQPGQYWNGQRCVSQCQPGQYWNGQSCVSQCQPGQCWDGERWVSQWQPGQYWDGQRCVAQCQPGQYWDGQRCVSQCQPGQYWDGQRCVSQCQPGQYWNGQSCVSQCQPGQYWN